MGKALIHEAMGILRQFQVAGELTPKKALSQLKETNPHGAVRLISLLFEQTPYYIIIDATAEDDTEYLKEMILAVKPEIKGHFVRNPHDESATYGLRHKFKDTYLFEVTPSKRRLDIELSERYPEYSRSTLQKYIKLGAVMVNGEVVTSNKRDVSEIDEIALAPPKKTDTSTDELPIVYIDDSIIVVDKPAGVLTHSKGALNDEFTVADFFRRYTTNALDTSRPGIIHRLDRETSGIIVGARTDEAALMLKKQFGDRTVKKHYSAVVDGVPKLDEAIIDLPIARNPSAPSTFRVDAKGKPALTSYKVLASNGTQSLVELKPKTGRTHQLRVHMQYINTPIAGDRVYGNATSAPRMCLHAHSLEITIPGSERKIFTAPVPKEFKELTS